MVPSDVKASRRGGRAVFVVILVAQLLLAFLVNCGGPRGPSAQEPVAQVLSGEAISRTGVAHDLLEGRMEGRQGLVGSLYWAPLPTLLVLPFVPLSSSGFASCIVAAFFAASAGTFLNAWWRSRGVAPVIRFGGVLLYEIQPQVLMSVAGGSSAILFATLIFAAFACLLDWLDHARLSSLAYLSIFIALSILTRYQATLFGLVVLLIVVVSVLPNRRERGYREATLIVFLAPPLYAAAVWFAANWLIMGDPIFFLRGMLHPGYAKASWHAILTEGCEWPMALVPMLLVAAVRRRGEKPAGALASVLILFVCLGGLILGVRAFNRTDRVTERKEMRSVVKYCLDNHADDRVVISGYRGYQLLRGLDTDQQKVFVHRMSMYMGKVLEQTLGKDLYILVPKPVGADRWEDVNLKYPGMYEGDPEVILSEQVWDHWRLFRVVRTDM